MEAATGLTLPTLSAWKILTDFSRSPLAHSGLCSCHLPRAGSRRVLPSTIRRISINHGFELEEELIDEPDVKLDHSVFEEVHPTVRRQKPKNKGKPRNARDALVELTSKTSLVPDEWLSVQKYQMRSKRERRQETLALRILRAKEDEAADRALKEEAETEARGRFLRNLEFRGDVDGSIEEGEISSSEEFQEFGENEWDSGVEGKEDNFYSESEYFSERAKPKNYREGVKFKSFEEIAERLKAVVEAERDSNSDEKELQVEKEEVQPVQLTAEEKALLNLKHVKFEVVSSRSWCPLHTLAASGQVYLAAKLIQKGSQVDALDKEGLTPLHKAVQSGRKTMIRLLLKLGANVLIRDKDEATLLHYAAQTGNHEIAKIFLRGEIDVNASDKDGWTALHVAVQSGRTELIRCLINRGADINIKNNDGNTPYDLALSFGSCFNFYDTIKFMKRRQVIE